MSAADSERGQSGEGVRTLTASDIVTVVGGTLIGDPAAVVSRVAPIDRAGPGDLTFLASARYGPALVTSQATIVLVSPELESMPGRASARIVVERPHDAVLRLLPKLYSAPAPSTGVHESARIGKGVQLGRQVAIGPFVVLGEGASIGDGCQIDAHTVLGAGVVMGRDCHLFPHTTLYAGTTLGDRVIVQSGVRLGSDGFGYVFRDGAHHKVPHVGRCLIGNDVEIGANSTIDRGSIDDTIVGDGTKIDNLVQIGHNVHIGKLCLLMALVGVAGSVRIGDGVILAGQVGVAGHLTIGSGARLAAQSGVIGDVPDGETWGGYPARPHREWLRREGVVSKLAGVWRRLERLLEERI